MDPRLVTVVLIVKIKGAFNRLYHCCDILLLITLNTTSWMMVRYLNDTNIEHHLMKSHIIHPYKSATSRKCCPESVSSELDSYLSLSFLISKIINSVQVWNSGNFKVISYWTILNPEFFRLHVPSHQMFIITFAYSTGYYIVLVWFSGYNLPFHDN